MPKIPPISGSPQFTEYDVIIIGGAIMGSSVAWFLSDNKDFDGRILVIEKDPTYQWASSSHTNSCTRQQFSNKLNVQISQFGVQFLRDFRHHLGGNPEIPEITLNSFGYLYLSDNPKFSEILRENQKMQKACGAGTTIMEADEIAALYSFYNLDDIILGSHNRLDEGYFDGNTMFNWWRRQARANNVEYITNEVVQISRRGELADSIELKTGVTLKTNFVVNASGPRAAVTAEMVGIKIPVEPRKRYTFVFDAESPLNTDLPLTIDPSGVHMRSDGQYYLCGGSPEDDHRVDFDDFEFDHSIWERKIWPAIANRVPAFETVKVINAWTGHYAYNTFDQNAIIGPHAEVSNFIFVNGFSGRGLQQSPAMGRGVSELIIYGEFRTLDMSELGAERIDKNQPFLEKAVI